MPKRSKPYEFFEELEVNKDTYLDDELAIQRDFKVDCGLRSVSDMLLRDYGVVTGRGNVRGALRPRNAVATLHTLKGHES